MQKGVQYFRDRYQEIRNYAYSNEMKKLVYKDLARYKQQAKKQMDLMDKSNTFDNYEELDFYKDKFTQLDNAMVTASKNKIGMKQFTTQACQILKEKVFTHRNSYLNPSPLDPKTTNQPPAQSKVLQSFFQEKRSKIVPEVGFRSLLENPPISPKNFKKRIGVNNQQLVKLRSENQDLKRKLQSGNFGISGGNLQVQIHRQQQRIRSLQNENQRLLKDNSKLKSQKSVTVYSSPPQQNYQDYLYSPYNLNPRENDLYKISMRGSQDSGSYYNQNFNREGFNQIHNDNEASRGPPSFSYKLTNTIGGRNYETTSQMNDYDRNIDRFSIFDMDMSKSHYSDMANNDGVLINSNGSSGVQDNRTAARNKIAFFKNSGMLIRDQDIQIAYKRTQTNNLSSNRIILYFNNKVNQNRKINVNYQYQQNYYTLNIPQKVRQVGTLKQSRQVIEVNLKNNTDLNSIIQTNVQVDGKRYKLWLPAIFIRFEKPREGMMQSVDKVTKIVYPSKIFTNQIQTQKIIQKIQIYSRGQAWAWGVSPIYEGPIKFSWRQSNKLQVTTSNKWIDFITFIMFDYR